jgi:hypothetical protein
MSVLKALLWLAAVALCVVVGWKIRYPTHAWNQKLTVTVSTPRGEVSGSSVVAVSWAENPFSGGWGGAPFHLSLRGDATTVDLGGGQFLFAMLGYEHSEEPHSTGIIPLKLLCGPVLGDVRHRRRRDRRRYQLDRRFRGIPVPRPRP